MEDEPEGDLSALTMEELIARSSLGSPEVMEYRRMTPKAVALWILYGAGYITYEELIAPGVAKLKRVLGLDEPTQQ